MKKAVTIAASLAVTALVSQGALQWSDDFESRAVGTGTTDHGAPWSGAGNSYNVQDDGIASPFGAGNNWLRMQGWGNPWTFVNNAQSASGVATVSFDLYFDTVEASDGFLRIAMSQTAGNAAVIDLTAATIGGFDQAVHIDIIANTSGALVPTDIGGTIGDGFVDLYINGSYTSSFAAADSDDLDGFGAWVNNGGTVTNPPDEIWADNFEYWDSAHVIPEPATIGLLGIAGAGLFVTRRLRRS